MRRSALIFLLVFSLFLPLANLFPGWVPSRAQSKSSKIRLNKLAGSLRERLQQSNSAGESARVIINLSEGANPQQVSQALTQNGGGHQNHLAALGLMVTDIPLNKLEEIAARNDISWISGDQQVRSLSTDNTSHIEVT